MGNVVTRRFITSSLSLSVTISRLHDLVHEFAFVVIRASSSLTFRDGRLFHTHAHIVGDGELASLCVLSSCVDEVEAGFYFLVKPRPFDYTTSSIHSLNTALSHRHDRICLMASSLKIAALKLTVPDFETLDEGSICCMVRLSDRTMSPHLRITTTVNAIVF